MRNYGISGVTCQELTMSVIFQVEVTLTYWYAKNLFTLCSFLTLTNVTLKILTRCNMKSKCYLKIISNMFSLCFIRTLR